MQEVKSTNPLIEKFYKSLESDKLICLLKQFTWEQENGFATPKTTLQIKKISEILNERKSKNENKC